MSKFHKYSVIHAGMPILIACSIVAFFSMQLFDRDKLHAEGTLFFAEYAGLMVLILLLISFGFSSVRKVFRDMERRKLEALLQSAWRTGKVIYNGKVYIVEELCDIGDSPQNGKCRSLIVRNENGDSRIYRLPIEKANEFKEIDVNS